jgi:hypothetical protein
MSRPPPAVAVESGLLWSGQWKNGFFAFRAVFGKK